MVQNYATTSHLSAVDLVASAIIQTASVFAWRIASTMFFQLFLALLLAPIHSHAQSTSPTTPYGMPWNSTTTFGSDGPWHAVTLTIGTGNGGGGNQVNLYPGGFFQSIVLSDAMCATSNNGPGTCLAAQAGLYDPLDSPTARQNFTAQAGSLGQWGSDTALNLTGQASDVYDTVTVFNDGQGRKNMNNITLSAVAASNYTLPDASHYPMEVGSLSLGAPQTKQNYNLAQGWTVPGWLRDDNDTASNSFGLHYGSASLNLTGSLVFGGYDKSRVLGSVGSFDLGFNNSMVASLINISFGVENGGSPFKDGLIPGGLLQENSSSNSISTIINPIIPYLLLSEATCSAIAQNLPVTFSPSLGLYVWNTADPLYTSILKAPTYLSFTFLNVGTTHLTINVPLQLLNLTLTPPLVSKTQQYFPCRPYTATNTEAGNGVYFLGRAFLQAAFVGVNWEQGKFFMAQAPGPAVGASQIVPMDPTATTIASNDISEFAGSWVGTQYWTALSLNSKAPSGGGGGGGRGAVRLSGGAIAGIVVGAIIGAVLLLSVILFCVRRRRRSSLNAAAALPADDEEHPPRVHEMPMESARHEIAYQDPQELGHGEAHEADGATLRYEMDGQNAAARRFKH